MLVTGARRGLVALVAGAVLATGFAGCGVVASSDGNTQVVAAFYPLAWAAQRVGGSRVDVTDLTVPGVEPHDLSLSVRQTAKVSGADLVIFEKGFQPAVDTTIANNSSHGWDVSATVRLHQTSSGPDPHFWQDPLRMAALARGLGTRLGEVDPGHSAYYARRADALAQQLTTLDSDYRAGLEDCRVHAIVVSHDAFDYLSKYVLTVHGIAGLAPESEPSAKHLRELQQLIRADHITTVFSEVLASTKLSEALAEDLDIASVVLDPIEGVAEDAPQGTDYLSIMRSNLAKLRKANSCS